MGLRFYKREDEQAQTWIIFLGFLRVFMYFEDKLSLKDTLKYWLNLLDLPVVLILKTG